MNDARFGVAPHRAFSCATGSDGAFPLPLFQESPTRKQAPSLSESLADVASDRTAERAELANLLGRLLARWWLADRMAAGGQAASADDDSTESNLGSRRHERKRVEPTKL